MSTYIPNSDISRINNGDSTVIVDHMFRDVLELSKKIYGATNGYFDPTVGVLVNSWGFGPGKELEMTNARVDSLLQYVGLDKVEIAPDNRIIKTDPNIYFDFNAADIKADICNLPFLDNSYDVILCNHVLEHIPDDTKAMEELFRILKPGGWGILQIPQDLNRPFTFEDNSITDKKERAKIFGQYDHVRIYGRDYFDKLRTIGFKVSEIDYSQTNLSPKEVDRYRLAPGEIIPMVSKSN